MMVLASWIEHPLDVLQRSHDTDPATISNIVEAESIKNMLRLR